MKKIIQVAAVALALASATQAQQAVQWKVENGGNGHWYATTSSPGVSWSDAASMSALRGGALATLTTPQENSFVVAAFQAIGPRYPWIGLRQSPDAVEPGGGWAWVSGEPLSWTNWSPSEPNGDGSFDADQANIWLVDEPGLGRPLGTWNDWHVGGPDGYMIEWSADCNGDGVVDYGQCRDGSLADYDADNVPDCCENGDACVVGNYPVQWRAEHGGNGHWYQLVSEGHPSWTQSKTFAEQRGGYLATLTSHAENDLAGRLSQGLNPMLLGGFQDHSSPNYSEPGGGWRWVTDEPWAFSNWGAGEPNNSSNGHGEPGEDYLYSWTVAEGFKWNDGDNLCPECPPSRFLIEWSADCNNDDIVDYGQIISAQLADANSDGIPDICQQPTCRDADLFRNGVINGADLGILLSQWGPAPSGTVSDINRDGQVDGADLGFLLNAWGPCPN